MEEAEILELYELHYSDLILLSSNTAPTTELERLESITKTIMETLGPNGPGLLSITAVPNASTLRRNLLPLARELALLNPEDRKPILKEHNLGSDVPLKNPDRSVSSFAMKLRYSQGLEATQSKPNCTSDHLEDLEVDRMREFQNLGNVLKELGFCMMEIGLCLARICDKAIGGQELEQSLLESGTAKGRLIHYHSALDNFVLKEQAGRRKGSTKRSESTKLDSNGNEAIAFGIHSNLWQQWHYDYGIFTVLTAPMFLLPSCSPPTEAKDQFSTACDQECPSPAGHSYFQIFDPNKNNVLMVKTSPESFIVQVGESADILSKGKFHSTLHCVCRPAKFENLSRETFVVFLQPAWSKIFSISDYPVEHGQSVGVSNEENQLAEHDQNKLTREIRKIVPPLSSRLKDGMTFAEFSQETTKQYYGGSGLQSNSR